MAWSSFDAVAECFERENGFTINKTSATSCEIGADANPGEWGVLMKDLLAANAVGNGSDFAFRFRVRASFTNISAHTAILMGIGDSIGNISQFQAAAAGHFVGVRLTGSSNNPRFDLVEIHDGSTYAVVGTHTFSAASYGAGNIYLEIAYDADGGVLGVPRVTMTAWSNAFDGTQVDQITLDLQEDNAFQYFYPISYGASSGSTWLRNHFHESIGVDFTFGSQDDNEHPVEVAEEMNIQDFEVDYTEVDGGGYITLTGQKLVVNQISATTGSTYVYKSSALNTGTAFTTVLRCRIKEDGYSNDSGGGGWSIGEDGPYTIAGAMSDSKFMMGLYVYMNSSEYPSMGAFKVEGGVLTTDIAQITTAATGWSHRNYLKIDYDPDGGTGSNGLLTVELFYFHPDQLGGVDFSTSVEITEKSKDLDNVYGFTSRQGGALYRYYDYDVFVEGLSWEIAGIPVAGVDTIKFSEVAERYSVAAAKAEGFKFSEVGSEVGELNVEAPSEGVEFGELAGLTHEVEGEDEVEFGEKASRNYEVVAVDVVEFSSLALRLNFAKETVEFGELASSAVVITVEATDGITFQEAAAHLPIEGCETDFVPSPTIPADPDTILYVYLQGPWATLAYTIRLTRPDYGDVRRNRLQVVVHRTRGGGRRVYKRTPSFKSLIMRFQGMSRKKLLELENFLEGTAGEDIKFIDHNGHVWKGNLLTSPADLSTEGRSQGEATLEFEGEVISS